MSVRIQSAAGPPARPRREDVRATKHVPLLLFSAADGGQGQGLGQARGQRQRRSRHPPRPSPMFAGGKRLHRLRGRPTSLTKTTTSVAGCRPGVTGRSCARNRPRLTYEAPGRRQRIRSSATSPSSRSTCPSRCPPTSSFGNYPRKRGSVGQLGASAVGNPGFRLWQPARLHGHRGHRERARAAGLNILQRELTSSTATTDQRRTCPATRIEDFIQTDAVINPGTRAARWSTSSGRWSASTRRSPPTTGLLPGLRLRHPGQPRPQGDGGLVEYGTVKRPLIGVVDADG
jgi:hypothetical protein